MLEKWGCKVGLKSPAHITIVPPFWMDETLENNLLEDVSGISKTLTAFTIITHNFSAFKPRTIFIEPVLNKGFQTVKSVADNFFKTHTAYNIKPDNRPFHPHITIATRDLHKKDFAEAWPLFENKTFDKKFEATGLSVLRHNKINWDVIYTANFTAAENV